MHVRPSVFVKAASAVLLCVLAIPLADAQTVSRISPATGSTAGGGRLDIIGSGLSSTMTVTVGGQNAPVIASLPDGSLLTVILPPGPAGPANVEVGATTLAGAYTYLDPATILFADDFNSGTLGSWTASPLGLLGNWSAAGDRARYNGGGHTQIYAGSASWADYTVETRFQLASGSNYPGGLRGRVNTSTGAAYAVWLYPGSAQIKLFRTGGWNIDSSGLALLQQATTAITPNVFHRLSLSFSGAQITVNLDSTTVITATDGALGTGAIALDVSNQPIEFEDVLVTQAAADTTPPAVTITAPASGTTLSGTVTVSASASDNVEVAGVQFLLDGAALGAEVTSAPYTLSWNTTTTSNGARTLSAQARDAAGNTATAANVSVTVANAAAGAPTITRISATAGRVAGGGQMDILGSNLSGATVTIGGASASLLSGLPDSSRITVRIPAGPVGSADVVVTTGSGTAALTNGYSYLNAATILFADDFNSGALGSWTASPLGLLANWSASGHIASYNGGGHTQIYAGSASWTDYTVETKFQLASGSNYPGGLRGRVNTSTGAAYAVWLYPGSSQIKLFRTGGWSIDSPGLALVQQATTAITPNVFHRLSLSFSGAQIAVSLDGVAVITATDSTLASGAVALDVSNQPIAFEDVLVTQAAADTTSPTVAITSPASGATVSGTITVTASAFDDVGVAGVQFLLDGASLGAEVTSAPYTLSWNTTTTANGAHTLSARARDAAGNTATAANMSVTVSQPSVTGISVTPSSFSLGFAGAQQPLTVIATYSDGSSGNVTSSAAYNSNNAAAATVSGIGIVNAVNNGNAAITASFGSASATATVAVSMAPPLLERISPPEGSANGGTRLDLMGHNLSSATTVSVGGTVANFVSALPDGSQMTVMTPTGAAGFADVVATNIAGSATGQKAYRYLDPSTILFADDFNLSSLVNWSASPLGLLANWNAGSDVADYNGHGHTQLYAGSSAWTNYSVRARFQIFNVTNYPGGLRGRLNLSTGVAYEAWLLPASAQLKLYRTGGWSVDTAGLVLLGQANVPYINPDQFHTLEMIFNGAQITVLLDGPAVLQASDAALASGAIALDVSNQHIQFDDVLVTTIPEDTVPPAIAISSPAAGTTVSGAATVFANATDNVGVTGVQFMLDGALLGSEQSSPPYSVSWHTANTTNGPHTLTAMARDGSGNVTTSAPVTVTVANSYDPTQSGQWTAPFDWPIVAINLTVMKTGEVVSWDGPPADGGSSATLWNPSAGTFTNVANPNSNMFCNGQIIMRDGRMLTAGGHADWGVGIPNTDIFDPVTRLWSPLAPMHFGRWYPTLTTLPDGRVLAVSGSDRCEACPVPTPEIYDPYTNTWTAYPDAPLSLPLYPFMFVLPDGRVLEAGSVSGVAPTEVFDLNTYQWTMVDPNIVDGHSAVMYQPGKIMKSGTGSVPGMGNVLAQPVTFVLNMNQPHPGWVQTAPMNFPRAYQNMTILPDGAVLVTGGETTLDGNNYANAVLPAELWSPASQTWTTMAPEQIGRLYHSSAVLLLDGRVLVAGSGRAATAPQLNAEIYSPPYLFRGPRPVISYAPGQIGYGSTFTLETPDAASITSVSLIGLSTSTHGFNNGQNFQGLAFQQADGALNIEAPANANLAPPGVYAVFILNGNGVPSVAAVIQIPWIL